MKMSDVLKKLDAEPETLTRIFVNDGTTPQFREFAEKLPKATALKELDIRKSEIGRSEETTQMVAKGVSENTSLTKLVLDSNYLGDKVKFFKNALSNNSSITALSVFNNNMHPDAANDLAELIKKDASLTDLNIGCNDLQDDGVKIIAQELRQNTTLRKLGLSNVELSDDGAKKLAKAFKMNSHLTDVDLTGNKQITSKGVNFLIEALRENSTLTHLKIDPDKLSPEIKDEITKLLEENKEKSSAGCSFRR